MIQDDPIDRWTAVHALTGFVAGRVGLSPPIAIGGAAIYETIEYMHEWPKGSKLFGTKRPESVANIAADLIVFSVSYFISRKLR